MHAAPSPQTDGPPFRFGRELALALVGPIAALAAVLTSRWIEYFASDAVYETWLEPSYLLLVFAAAVVFVSVLFSRFRYARGYVRFMVPIIGAFGALCFSGTLGDAALHQRGIDVECHVESTRDIPAVSGRGGHGPQTRHYLDCGDWSSASFKTAHDAEREIGTAVIVTHDPRGRVDPAVGGVNAHGELIWTAVGVGAIAISVGAWLLIADDGRIRDLLLRPFARRRRAEREP